MASGPLTNSLADRVTVMECGMREETSVVARHHRGELDACDVNNVAIETLALRNERMWHVFALSKRNHQRNRRGDLKMYR